VFFPDTNRIVVHKHEKNGGDIWVLPLEGDRQPRPFVKGGYPAGAAKFSPDGHWIVYSSMESGRPEIYAQAWPGPGAKLQISSDGGTDPVWRRDGREIFYRNGSAMMAVPVTTTPTFRAAAPQLLWTADYTHGLSSSCGWRGTSRTSYDVSADGQRFLMIKDSNERLHATQLIVVLNWAEELQRAMAGARPATE